MIRLFESVFEISFRGVRMVFFLGKFGGGLSDKGDSLGSFGFF